MGSLALGRLLEGLGRLLGRLETVLGRHGSFGVISESLGPDGLRHLGGQRGSKMRSKWDPRRTKIEDKNEDEKRRSCRSSWGGLGSILGRLGFRLGGQKSPETVCYKRFRENYVFEEDKAEKGNLDGTWADFDAKKDPKRLPNRSQKWCQNAIEQRSNNKIGF